jgi:c-di-GMP-binding flagellar brake protein YcgR
MSQRIERRRTPRTELPDEEVCGVEIRQRVRLLDISQSGVLVSGEAPLPVGTRGQLRAGLAALPFSADIAVRRHAGGPAHPQGSMGAQFAAIDERSMRYLEQFLMRGKPSGT